MQDLISKLFDINFIAWLLLWEFFFIGLLNFCLFAFDGLKAAYRTTTRPQTQSKTHSYEAYGRKDTRSWALVTGGSDGIGLAMCKNLARQGFNIVMVSRNEIKIKEKLMEIKRECQPTNDDFKAKFITVDFTRLDSMRHYKKKIFDRVQDIDIGVVVLNAGHAYEGSLEKLSNEEVESQKNCLEMQYIYLAKCFAEMLSKRYTVTKQKGGMVFVSSMGSKIISPGLIPYVAAKHFTSGVARGLSREMKGKVDVIDYIPSYVKTNIIKGLGIPDPWTISPKRAAEVCLRDLGIEESSCGSFRHWIFHQLSFTLMAFDFVKMDTLKKMQRGYVKRMKIGKKLGGEASSLSFQPQKIFNDSIMNPSVLKEQNSFANPSFVKADRQSVNKESVRADSFKMPSSTDVTDSKGSSSKEQQVNYNDSLVGEEPAGVSAARKSIKNKEQVVYKDSLISQQPAGLTGGDKQRVQVYRDSLVDGGAQAFGNKDSLLSGGGNLPQQQIFNDSLVGGGPSSSQPVFKDSLVGDGSGKFGSLSQSQHDPKTQEILNTVEATGFEPIEEEADKISTPSCGSIDFKDSLLLIDEPQKDIKK